MHMLNGLTSDVQLKWCTAVRRAFHFSRPTYRKASVGASGQRKHTKSARKGSRKRVGFYDEYHILSMVPNRAMEHQVLMPLVLARRNIYTTVRLIGE